MRKYVIMGVPGSGKSSLIEGCLPTFYPDALLVDQSLTSGSRRSNLATYSGMLDHIRKAFATAAVSAMTDDRPLQEYSVRSVLTR